MKLIYSASTIQHAIASVADNINRDYIEKDIVLVGVLKGCFMFLSDLVKQLRVPAKIEFVRIRSYSGTERSDINAPVMYFDTPLRDKHVIIVEDIIDTGHTVKFLKDYITKLGPKSLKVCSIFNKPSRHSVADNPDYFGLTVPNKFVVGYGLDCNEHFRDMVCVYSLEEEDYERPTVQV